MKYTVHSSEKLRKSGADAETKAMLYLMNYHKDGNQMHFFIIDFFNDVTGMDRMGRRLWDVQSKASKSGSAKDIGRELVTLFKNYLSNLEFQEFILFVGAVPSTFRRDEDRTVFQIDNINDRAIDSIRAGLYEECKAKTYINDSDITDENMGSFLNSVWFVIDTKTPQEYIREIISAHPNIIPEDSKLLEIFNEIRNKQAEKKNTNVEGEQIEMPHEVLNYGRHLTTNEIRLLVLQRIISTDPIGKGMPLDFAGIVSHYPPERRRDLLDDCQRSLCRALFNNSLAQEFWTLFDEIYVKLMEKPDGTLDYIFNKIDRDKADACIDFDALSLKFFIAKVREGIFQ